MPRVGWGAMLLKSLIISRCQTPWQTAASPSWPPFFFFQNKSLIKPLEVLKIQSREGFPWTHLFHGVCCNVQNLFWISHSILMRWVWSASRWGGVSDQKQVSRRDELRIRAVDAHVCGGLASCTKMPWAPPESREEVPPPPGRMNWSWSFTWRLLCSPWGPFEHCFL